MAKWTFRIEGEPVPWTAQMRNAARSPSFQRMVAWQTQIRVILSAAWGTRPPLAGPVQIDTTFYRGWPERAPQSREKAKQKWADAHILMAPDVGNYRKAFLDALEPQRYFPGIILNDSQVIGGMEWKAYTQEAWGYTIMCMKEVNPDDSNHAN